MMDGGAHPSPSSPRDVAAPDAAVRAACEIVREVAATDLDTIEGPELVDLLASLDETSRLVEACRARVLAAVDRTEAWRTAGGRDASLADWRSRTTREGRGKAHREVRTARTLATTPGAADALTDGQLTPEHAEALSRVASSGGTDRRSRIAEALADPEASGALLEAAKHLDAPRFARAAQAWAARLDPMTLEADHATQRRARFLTVADTPAGTILKGQLDAMAGHRLRLALEAVTPVPSLEDDRDHGQRAADALDTLAQAALTDPTSKPGGHVPPHVSIIMTEQTLAGLRALAARDGDAADGPVPAECPGTSTSGAPSSAPHEGISADHAFDPATLEDGTPVPVSETARILCDAQVTRIVVDAESVPVDLGRTKRLWSGAQRRLVIARDRHCAFPGCQIPARWCEIHHIAWWARDGGRTDIDNAVLLCSTHHGAVHAHHLTIERQSATTGPPGASLPLASYTITDPAGRPWGAAPAGAPKLEPDEPLHDGQSSVGIVRSTPRSVVGGHGTRSAGDSARATGPPRDLAPRRARSAEDKALF